MLFFWLALHLSFRVSPVSAQEPLLFSVCGQFHPIENTLLLGDTSLDVDGKSLPPKAGDYCLVGTLTAPHGDDAWKFHARRFDAAPPDLRYPVLTCGPFKNNAFLWGDETLRPSEQPPAGVAARNGWCADGKRLPQQRKYWLLPVERFRPAPDPDSRSGLSIGNQ